MKKILTLFLVLFLTIIVSSITEAKNGSPLIYKIDIKKEISNTTHLYLSNGLKEANTLKADAVLIHLNTYGGLVDAADSMRTAILYSPIPVYVFIDNNAASAGALISIACKKIFMRKGANIGAATVVNQTGDAMPDKYQSYMRSMIRSTAEAHGKDTLIQDKDTLFKWKRDPLIAEAMVDERVIVPNLIDTGKVLTFTSEEAIKWGYCDGIAESPEEVITQYLGYQNYNLKSYTPSWFDNLKGFLMSPILQSFLIILIVGGIYFEMQTPGMGFPSLVALTSAILYFAPLYLDGLAANWEILIFFIGILLIVIEIFVIPGFGIIGISGILLVLGGLTTGLLNNTDFHFEKVGNKEFGEAILTVLIGLVAGFISTIWLSNKIGNRGIFQEMALHTDLEKAKSTMDLSSLVEKEGIAYTVLRPSGKIKIGQEIYDGISESGFIEKEELVKVIRTENAQIYVIKLS